jgi:putative restriction endonuclease
VTVDERARSLLFLSRYFGTDQTAAFLKDTQAQCPGAGLPMIHSLIQGIYKPKDSPYVLSVWSRSAAGAREEAYPDTFEQGPNGTWDMRYAPMRGRLDVGVNKALFACMQDRVPILVIVTTKPPKTPGGARYRLLGLAIVAGYEPATRHFLLKGCTAAVADALRPATSSDVDLEEVDLRNGLILPFQVGEPRVRYVASRAAREQAFQRMVLEEYRHQCSVCQSMFLLREASETLVEAEAAHIIGVGQGGPDDPRNGLSLCRRHHWAFDRGLFCVTESLEVMVSPAVSRAKRERFDLEEYHQQALTPPTRSSCRPSLEAIDWHRQHVYRAS